ncbi:MAG TPA: hypothetical protein P5065_05895 [Candidatus Ratteibacteria bacterium]|nr:hypothetical protein [bacterium]HRS06554.1 hypothetical protein [Candidatus Ratteibacteria bacterium]
MISCTDFILAYSEFFKFLHERYGEKAVIDFWNYLSDKYLTDLRKLVKKHGIKGCWIYWSKTLNEEAANFTMELIEEKNQFKITMHHCPSKSRLLKTKHIEPYHDYCKHCDVLYRRILEPLGFEYTIDLSKSNKARCKIVIRQK